MLVSTIEEAMLLRSSDNSHERLKAARFFLSMHSAEHIAFLEDWAVTEKVGWVKRALATAIDRARSIASVTVDEFNDDNLVNIDQAYALAVRDVASALLHELEPLIGLLEVKIKKEINNYEGSESQKHFSNLQNYFAAISCIRVASQIIKVEAFDCSELIAECSYELGELGKNGFSSIGPGSVVLVADRRLLKMALLNGLKNASESVELAKKVRDPKGVIVNWGETAVEYWIAIIDDGVGLGRMSGRAIKIGDTTKPGHLGMGLTIVKQAMQTLNGGVTITSPNDAGAVFELRWLK